MSRPRLDLACDCLGLGFLANESASLSQSFGPVLDEVG